MFLEINGLNLNYLEEGLENKESVLIVHGWGANISTVKSIINLLKHNFHVIAVDLPGHGSSEIPRTVFGTEDFANTIKKFCEVKGLKDFYYIGHSFGGKVGIYIASNNINFIKKLILIDASGIKPKLDKKTLNKIRRFKFLKKIYITFFGEKNLEKFYKKFGSSDFQEANGIMRNILVKVVNEDLTSNLSKIDVKTCIIWGRNDMDTPLYMGKIMHDEIPNSSFHILEGGHYSYLDDSIGFGNIVKNFLMGD